MKSIFFILLQALILVHINADECRPSEIVQYEESCFEDHSGFIERVQQKATSFFESAKKKLGISTEDEQPDRKPKKCGYYQCILKKMHIDNQHGLPDMNELKQRYAKDLASDVENMHECFAMPENVEEMMEAQEDTVARINTDSSTVTVKQARETMNEILCEINAQVYRCLSLIANKDTKCPLFVFP